MSKILPFQTDTPDQGSGTNDIKEYKRHAINAVSVLTVRRILIQFIQSLSNIILARILFPQDFGIFALIFMFINIFTLFADVGLHAALIQKEKIPTRGALRSVFTIHVVLGFILTLFVWIAAPFIAGAYREQMGTSGVAYLRWAAVSIVLYNLRLVPAALLERSLSYFKLVIPEVLEIGTQQVVAIVFALNGHGTSSLLYGLVAGRFIALALFFIMQPWSIGFAFKWEEIKELRKFGFSYQVFQLFGVASGIMAPVIIGNLVGTHALGLVIWAIGVSALPLIVSEIIGRALFTVGARAQAKKAVIAKMTERSLQMAYFISLPLNFLMISLARPITFLIFTDKWQAGIDLIYLFSIQSIFLTSTTIFSQVLLAMGEARLVRNINFYKIIGHWFLAVVLTIVFGIYGFAISYVIASLVFIPLLKVLRTKLTFHYIHNISDFLLVSGLMGFVIFVVQLAYPAQTIIQLCIYITVGILFYFVVLSLIRFSTLKRLFQYMYDLLPLFRKN